MKKREMTGFQLRLPPAIVAAHRALMAAALTAWPLYAGAQILNDPTRPPASLLSATPESEGRQGAALQSVMISPTERVAIIGGDRVKVGDRYGDARVVRISESEVELRSPGGSETLRLYPNIEMKPVKPPMAVTAPKATNKPKVKPNNVRRKPQ